jgi:hypothetical protein
MNSQLFFDPVNPEQKNYWHRDMQYTGMSDKEIQHSMGNDMALHFRIPLRDEPGIELVPGTHYRWDNELEYQVRHQLDGHTNWENLPGGKILALQRGDLLVFSANIIHRGLYSHHQKTPRFTLDLLFCDTTADLLRYARRDAFPDPAGLDGMNNTQIFSNAIPLLIN